MNLHLQISPGMDPEELRALLTVVREVFPTTGNPAPVPAPSAPPSKYIASKVLGPFEKEYLELSGKQFMRSELRGQAREEHAQGLVAVIKATGGSIPGMSAATPTGTVETSDAVFTGEIDE